VKKFKKDQNLPGGGEVDAAVQTALGIQ